MASAERQLEIIHKISEEILEQASSCASEQIAPGWTSDDSDDFIKTKKENVEKLRRIRGELEVLFTGMI